MIRTIIVDPHAVVRTGLQLIFEATQELEIVDEASNGDELLEKIQQRAIDVVILEPLIPGKEALDVLKALKKLRPGLPVIIFTMHPEERLSLRMFKNGAYAYINKESNLEELIKAVKLAVESKKYYTPTQTELIADSLYEKHQELHEKLTDREFQVMTLLARGLTKSEIAAKLSVSKNTINNHRNHILKKMDLPNNSRLTKYAVQKGIID